ncbi:hypothetical protein [Rhodocyclus purpureus]|uniref:hypothetical protein n=1 Tax=Rhodocyclus purpureus TaxID=1067 RepID=UPI0019136EBD|nr:hypothetical protein [Rhodocyclus purpureus]
MPALTLHPGPRLLRPARSDDSPPDDEDVGARAVEFLFEPLELAPDLRLRDLFGLLGQCPALLTVYRRFYAEELCAEAALGPLPASSKLLSIELKQAWNYDSHARAYSDVRRLQLSVVREPDHDDGCPPDADGLVRYSLAGSSLRPLLDLPLRLKSEVDIHEADRYSTRSGQRLRTVRCSELTLGDLLQSVLWELTWFGPPATIREFVEEMAEGTDEAESWREMDADEFMDQFFGDDERRACELLFESIGTLSARKITNVLDRIPDRCNGRQWLARNLGKQVQLRPAFRRLNGRDLRQAFGEARSAGRSAT